MASEFLSASEAIVGGGGVNTVFIIISPVIGMMAKKKGKKQKIKSDWSPCTTCQVMIWSGCAQPRYISDCLSQT